MTQPVATLLKSQTGAMFGMDARVALIIASVLAAAGATTMMSKLDRSRVQSAELGIEILRDAVESHYKAKGVNELVRDIDTLFDEGFIEDTSQLTDPWGNPWEYKVTYKDVKLEDIPIRIHLATIHSSGKDSVDDSPSMVTSAEWDNWAAENDDIGIKFSSIEIEKERITEYRGRGKLIVDKLHAYESSKYIESDNVCESDETKDWCDRDNDPNFTTFNYYPISNLDSSGAAYYDEVEGGDSQAYESGDDVSMEALMNKLGLPRAFAKDPWGRVLCYHSNIDQKRALPERPPFTASIWYSEDGLCEIEN